MGVSREVKLRRQTGLTQQALADALGLSRRTVQNYERDGAPRWYAMAVERLIQVKEEEQGR